MSALFALFCAAAVSTSPEVTLIDFRSDSCGPCRAMDPLVHEMKDAGMPIRIVSVDREPGLAQQFRVGPIPCFVVVANGKEVVRHVGKASRGELENMLRLGQAAASAPQDQAANPAKARDRSAGSGTPIQLVNDSANSKPRLNGMPRGGQANLGQSLGQMVELEAPRIAKPPVKEVDKRSPLPDDSVKLPKLAGQANAANAQAIPASLRDDLLQTSVRLILHDDKGRATGSGTVIDCREGEALILTCGHIFREWSERGRVSVDFFDGAAERNVPARVVKYNLKSDVALLAISTRRTLRVAKVASPRTRVQKGDAVLAAGCEHGEDVAPYPSKITKIDRYVGPPNLCIAGQPKQGRSGGGLFNSQGLVIGVCNAADQQDDEGLYAALGAIHQLLDEAKLEFVYRDDAPAPSFQREFDRQLSHEPPAMPNSMPTADRNAAAIATMDRQPTQLQFPAPGANNSAANMGLNPPPAANPAAASPPTANPLASNELLVIFPNEKSPAAQGRVVHLRDVSPDLLARLIDAEKLQQARTPQPATAPNGLMPTPNPAAPSGPGTKLLPNTSGLRRDASAASVSFNR